jgi:hypothetical protein
MPVRVTTTDLYESSFLACRGVRLADVWVDRGRLKDTVVFVFEGNGQLTELQRAYHTGAVTVNLADFRRSLVHLRRRLHAALSNQHSEGTRCHAPAPEPAAVVS